MAVLAEQSQTQWTIPKVHIDSTYNMHIYQSAEETPELETAVARVDRLQRLKFLVLDAVRSPHSKTAYDKGLSDFLNWYHDAATADSLTKAVVQRWVTHLETLGLSPSTINLRLCAVRKLATEAADNGLMDRALAQGIARARGPKQAGTHTGNWLTKDQAERLINAPNAATLKGKRDRAILAIMVGCGLRRSEVSDLTFNHVAQREGRWVILDLIGKGGRRRTVPAPSWVKVAIDLWAAAAGISAGPVFRPLNNRHELTGERLLPQNIMEAVSRYGTQIGVAKLAPHDLRRSFAKLAHKGKSAIEEIQLSLGHVSIQTTERYLGIRQSLTNAPCDRLGLEIEFR
jgi:site-specific recombinase XerC